MNTQADYLRLQQVLNDATARLTFGGDVGPAFTDVCQDRENVLDGTGASETDADFWDRMCASAIGYAQQVASENDLDVSKLVAKWEAKA